MNTSHNPFEHAVRSAAGKGLPGYMKRQFDDKPTGESLVRQPAYDAVWRLLWDTHLPSNAYAYIWRAVECALDEMGIPDGTIDDPLRKNSKETDVPPQHG